MTFATLRALHNIIGDALDDIENVFRHASAASDPLDALRSPISPSPSPLSPYSTNAGATPYSPYSPYSPTSSVSQSPGPYPSPSLLSPRESSTDSRAPSPAPSYGTSSLSSYSGTGTYSSRASSRVELADEAEMPRRDGVTQVTPLVDVEQRIPIPPVATNTPPESPVILSNATSTATTHLVIPTSSGLSSTPVRAPRKRSNTVTSASNAFRRVSNLLGVTSRHSSNHSVAHTPAGAATEASTVPVLDAATTPTSTPARSVLRPCGGSALDSPSANNPLSPIAFASPASPPYVTAPTPVRTRAGSITASVSALTRACTTAVSLSDSPGTPNLRSGLRGSPARSAEKESPSPIRFAPNPHVPSTLMSPQTPKSVATQAGYGAADSPRTPTSGARDRRRPTPLALLPALTPTSDEERTGTESGQQLPTPASLFAASSPTLAGAHTPRRGAVSGGAGLISSSQVSLSAVGSTPRGSASVVASQSVPALGAAWEEPTSGSHATSFGATTRKMGMAPCAVPTPPPSGRTQGAGRPGAPELDWPVLDEAYYVTQQEGQHPAEGKGKANASSGSPHTPGGPRTPATPGASVKDDGAAARARREVAERLSESPVVLAAVSRLVAACGQMCASVQRPFLTVCDAAMGYHLPAGLRLLEAAHIPEILRDAGPKGMHVEDIARRVGEIRAGKKASASPTTKAKGSSGESENRNSGETQDESREELGAEDDDEDDFGVNPALLSHVLRLLATHHITREVRPNVFANNRVSSAMDSGRSLSELMDAPEEKYEGTNGIAAFVGLCTDELFKSAAYLADCYLPPLEESSRTSTTVTEHVGEQVDEYKTGRQSKDSAKAEVVSNLEQPKSLTPNTSLADLALGKRLQSASSSSTLTGPPMSQQMSPATPCKQGVASRAGKPRRATLGKHLMHAPFNLAFRTDAPYFEWLETEENSSRLRRFGRAMTGTAAWEVPGAIVGGFPWHSLPQDSVVVDVGGGIGSTSLLLAHAFPHLRFLVQDRPQVVTMGEAAWRDRSPQFLETGRAAFQAHDFFRPQPLWPTVLRDTSGVANKEDIPAVFLLRVITHDWPDLYVTRLLLHLRRAAGPDTKLLLADWILPLACIDEDPDPETPRERVEMTDKMKIQPLPGTVRTLAPEGSPLLPNLGKANANAYWLDLTMRVTFNAQERTLREIAALTLTAGWRIVQVTRTEGSLFGHVIAVPTDVPQENLALLDVPLPSQAPVTEVKDGTTPIHESRSPAMGDTFCSFVALPSEDDVQKGVKAGRKAAQGWQTRANEWRQRLVKKSSAIWRDRKNSVVQQPQPPVPLIPSLELLPAVEVGVHPQGRSSDTADTTDSSAPRRPVPGNVAVNARTEGQRDDDRDKDRRKPMGLRRVFSRAQLGSRGT